MRKKLLSTTLVLLAVLIAVAPNLSPRAAAQEGEVFKIWHYESPNGAMGIAWQAAMDKFQEMHPDVTIEFESRGFEEIRQTAPMILNSDEVPDVMEYNKGNATAGFLGQRLADRHYRCCGRARLGPDSQPRAANHQPL